MISNSLQTLIVDVDDGGGEAFFSSSLDPESMSLDQEPFDFASE